MSITVQRQLALSDLTSSKRGQTGGIERKPERKRKEIYMSWHRTAHRTYRFEQEEERREKKDSDNDVLSVIANTFILWGKSDFEDSYRQIIGDWNERRTAKPKDRCVKRNR